MDRGGFFVVVIQEIFPPSLISVVFVAMAAGQWPY